VKRIASLLICMALHGGGLATAQSPAVPPGDWMTFNRTLAGDRFSPVSEINRDNVARLRPVCTYTLPEVVSLQTGPLVIDGTMYFTSESTSYAIDASNCTEKWRRVLTVSRPSLSGAHRGLAYLDGMLFRGTSDAHVVALDAKDGQTKWDVALDIDGPGVAITMAPIAYDHKVFVGNAGGDQVGVTGHVYALDAGTGRTVWRFDAVPNTDDARTTWGNAHDKPLSGGGFWTSFTLDTARRLLYAPAGNPAPDFDLAMRPGKNLYTNSVLAIDIDTGKMVAYNQIVPNDFHDWDVDSPPALVTTRSGRRLVLSANKDGVLSVLDRDHNLAVVYQQPTTTRLNITSPLSRTHDVRFCPGILGGSEWNGASYDPTLNLIFVGAVDWCASVRVQATDAPVPAQGALWFGAETPVEKIQDPVEQARGRVTAFDADTGAVRWKFQTARPVNAAVTPTAGGLVFTADLGGRFYAFDATTGRVLWQYETGQSTGGGIVTYLTNGGQRVAIASGMKSPIWPGGADASRIVIFGVESAR
jgi:alcohol dehydrogenase (cytochrome c)